MPTLTGNYKTEEWGPWSCEFQVYVDQEQESRIEDGVLGESGFKRGVCHENKNTLKL